MMKKDMKTLLSKAFEAPAPTGKQAFLKNIRPREVSMTAFVWQQVSYIRLSVWIFAVAVIALVIAGSLLHLDRIENIMVYIMPFTAAISVLETKRSSRFNMSEIEMVTRFSLRSVIFARMIVFGILSFIMLCISVPVICLSFKTNIFITGIRSLIPYLLTMIISLLLERSVIGRKSGYLSLVVASLIMLVTFWINHFNPAVIIKYTSFLETWGLLTVSALIALTLFEQWKTIKNVEVLA